MRDGAAQHGAVQHPGELDVVDVLALAADEARVLLALHAAEADGAFLDGGHQLVTSSVAPAGCSAAQRIDRTIVA